MIPQALCSAGLPRSPVPNMVGMDVAPSDPGAVACAATPPSSSTRRDLVIRFQAGAHHQQIAARRMWLSTPQGPTAINFDLAPPLSSSGADANPLRHQQTKKPAMSSHGRSHHSLSATQGARIRVERVIASISDCLRRLSGRPREASPNYQGPGTKKPAIVCHGRSHHLLRVAQGARIRVDVSTHPYSVPRASRTPALSRATYMRR